MRGKWPEDAVYWWREEVEEAAATSASRANWGGGGEGKPCPRFIRGVPGSFGEREAK